MTPLEFLKNATNNTIKIYEDMLNDNDLSLNELKEANKSIHIHKEILNELNEMEDNGQDIEVEISDDLSTYVIQETKGVN